MEKEKAVALRIAFPKGLEDMLVRAGTLLLFAAAAYRSASYLAASKGLLSNAGNDEFDETELDSSFPSILCRYIEFRALSGPSRAKAGPCARYPQTRLVQLQKYTGSRFVMKKV